MKVRGAGAAEGAVDEIDLVGIEVGGEGVAPAPLAVVAVAAAVADGGVADEDRYLADSDPPG